MHFTTTCAATTGRAPRSITARLVQVTWSHVEPRDLHRADSDTGAQPVGTSPLDRTETRGPTIVPLSSR
ncbi:unnamed protein product [Lampetra planeri]